MGRNRYIKYLLLLFLIFLANVFPIHTEAASRKKLIFNKTYTQFDITNDNVPDKVRIIAEGNYDDYFERLIIHINGKQTLTIETGFYKGDLDGWVQCELLKMDNGNEYLYLYLGGDNGDGPIEIYEYQVDKLVKIVDIDDSMYDVGGHIGCRVKKVSGNKIHLEINAMSKALAYVKFDAAYKVKNGKLIQTSKVHKIDGYYKSYKYGKGYLTTIKSMWLYKDYKGKHKGKKISKGNKVKVTKCYINAKKIMFYGITKTGYKGWFKSPKDYNKKFMEIAYAG